MKVVFVDNFFYTRLYGEVKVEISPHLGLMTLATLVERDGHEVAIVDPKAVFCDGRWVLPSDEFFDAWADAIAVHRPDIVGFTALGRTLPHAVRAAQRVKNRLPRAPVILGGPHATIIGETLLKEFDCFDIIVRYEAEPLIVDLIRRLYERLSIEDLPNLVYRQAGSVHSTLQVALLPEMDSLPPPAMHLYPEHMLRTTEIALEAGRGCPFACTFCSTANFFKRRYRVKSNARLIEEMEDARTRFGVSAFILNHDLFGLRMESLREFCAMIEGRGFTWKCSMRPDTIGLAMLPELARAGCKDVYFGIETGSEHLQALIKKKLDLGATRRTIREVLSIGMTCTASFITGFPEETQHDLDATLDMVGEMLSIDPLKITVQLHVLSPEPGSELAAQPQTILFDGIGPELDDLVDHDLVRQSPRVFSVFYHFRTALSRAQVVYASAFVSYLIPQLGTSLVVHLVSNYFGKRLSAMFHASVPVDVPPPTCYEQAVKTLWAGIQKVATTLGGPDSYVVDLVRFSRMLAIWPFAERDRGAFMLASFSCDLSYVIAHVLRQPHATLPPSSASTQEHWFVIADDGSHAQSLTLVDARQGRAMYELGMMATNTDDGSVLRRFPELRMLAVFGELTHFSNAKGV